MPSAFGTGGGAGVGAAVGGFLGAALGRNGNGLFGGNSDGGSALPLVNAINETTSTNTILSNLADIKAGRKADQKSLGELQSMRDKLVTFERTALANADVFMATAQKIKDSGSPWMNKPIRELASGAFGSEAQAAANTALQTIVPEFAKINSGSLNGVLSDNARHEERSHQRGQASGR